MKVIYTTTPDVPGHEIEEVLGVISGNVVQSTAVGQMRIRYFGRGLIKDNLSPGWIVRLMNKIF